MFAILKTRLLINAARRSGRARAGLAVLSLALGGSMLSFVVVIADAAHQADGGLRFAVAFTTMWIAWIGLPFLLGGIDDAVDPDRLAELPLHRSEIALGTVVAASIGVIRKRKSGGAWAVQVVVADPIARRRLAAGRCV